jgi:hypothetical protein
MRIQREKEKKSQSSHASDSATELNHTHVDKPDTNEPTDSGQHVGEADHTVDPVKHDSKPELSVSQAVVRFPWILPNKQKFSLLKISQRHASTPITLTTNAPEQFQLASDDRPAFLSKLTFTPSATGTYVHIRYTPNGFATQHAELQIQTSYEIKKIRLIGQSVLPSALRASTRVVAPPQSNIKTTQRQTIPSWLILFGLIVLGEIGYLGYNNRCQIVPGLCQPDTKIGSTKTNALGPSAATSSLPAKRVSQVSTKPVPTKRR